jgi:uncharacterized protein YeeX (DUF496 family)
MSLIREVMTLTSNVGELKNEIDRITIKVENHTERIVKLETREELLAQKMTNEAIKAVYSMNSQYFDRLSRIEKSIGINPDNHLPPTTQSQIQE